MSTEKSVGILKAKTGCLTCKKRRIKCGEEKPICRRCHSAKRDCTYNIFATPQLPHEIARRPSQPSTSPGRLLSSFSATENEWQAFAFYFQRASISLGGIVDSDFWHGVVLQVSEAHPLVRHALFAISAIFRHTEECASESLAQCSCQHYGLALRYYNKSIAGLREHLQHNNPTPLAALTYTLYTCIEALLGHDQNVLSLIRQGYTMLLNCSHNSTLSKTDAILSEHVATQFSRLRLLSVLFGQPVGAEKDGESLLNIAVGAAETAADAARNGLFTIMNNSMAFQVEVAKYRGYSTAYTMPPEWLTQWQQDLLHSLERWYQDSQKLSINFLLDVGEHKWDMSLEGRRLTLLVLYYLNTKTWVSTVLSDDITCHDHHAEVFKTAVHKSEMLLIIAEDNPGRRSLFSIEIGLIGILFYVAVKCRISTIRKRALSLLYLTPHKEGLWDRAETITVVRRVIELEDGLEERRVYDVSYSGNYTLNGVIMIDVTFLWRASSDPLSSFKLTESLIVTDQADVEVVAVNAQCSHIGVTTTKFSLKESSDTTELTDAVLKDFQLS
ncbi:hypothetical protein BP6252_14010 [Coleophoma cylindrospora]|uniref:Zn(2)-C6 fungal-type domain-containing protein n=1 Tax=Coleophoma cylindrospora TaxID=1849047 RepID=A0A3D8Q4V0_9HELO|nr:hypothetical protein BP6252_14010 [Coleophoma cylindrospora]